MGIISEGLRHQERSHAAMMDGVTGREKYALLSPMAEEEEKEEAKIAIVRGMIAARKAGRGYKVWGAATNGWVDEPERGNGFSEFCFFLAGSISTAILILGAWVRFGG